MRHLVKLILVGACLGWVVLPASADPPEAPYGQSSAFPLNTNRIGFADATPLVLTAAPPASGLPQAVKLGEPLPNPFNPVVTIPFSVGRGGVVELGIYDLRGRQVRRLFTSRMAEGSYREQWDGLDHAGAPMPTGVYLVRIKLDTVQETRKISLVK